MAFWPRNERTKKPPLVKDNALVKEQNRNYPNLEPGLIGAATLLEDKNKRLEWAFVNKPSNKVEDSTRLKFGKQVDVFPPTRSIQIQNAPSSIRRRAEQGANFLRTYLPDVEIAENLIRDQLVEETALCRELERFDPYSGNLLDFYEPQNASDSAFLIFPTGETNRDLNISAISYPEASRVVFKPSATPAFTFLTPIQQIVVLKDQDANLAVRTYSTTQLFSLKQQPNAYATLAVTELVSFSRADTNDEVIVDVNHLASSEGMLVVSDGGTVFNCTVGDGRKLVNPLHKSYLSSSLVDYEFWRLSTGSNPHAYFIMSSEKVWQHDIRTDSAQAFFSGLSGKHLLTSIEDNGTDNILRLCSTNQIIWMDIRFPNKPLLAYSHGRDYDRYLSVRTVNNGLNNPLTLLTSRNNALTTVYDVSRSIEGLVQFDTLPYVPSSEASVYQKHVGQQFISSGDSIGIVRLSERGGVEYSELLPSELDSQINYTVEMPQEVQVLATAYANTSADIGPLGRQEFSQVDLYPAYNALFRRHFQEAKKFEQENAEAIFQLLDYFPSYMQNIELPIEHMLTTYDIAFRAGDEPDHPSRADFLTESLINSKRGYQALKQGQLSPQLVKVPWHRSILPTLLQLDKDFPMDPAQSMEYLQKYNLADSENRSSRSRQYEQEACEQLTLDLALSSDVFSETPVFKPGQNLEVMTEALSLGDEPPPIEFGYLKPLEKFPAFEREKKKSDIPELPIGVRLLLKEWDTNDPNDYVYQDQYNDATSVEPLKPPKPTVPGETPNFTLQNQRPPRVMASSAAVQVAPPEISRRTVPKVQSQDYFAPLPDAGLGRAPHQKSLSGFSQELLMSTQVLPGPHGGRPGVKKKQAKKRLGGF